MLANHFEVLGCIRTSITLHYVTLHYMKLHYIKLRYVTLRYITVHYIRTYSTYVHTYVHTYIHTYMHTYIHTDRHTHLTEKRSRCVQVQVMLHAVHLFNCDVSFSFRKDFWSATQIILHKKTFVNVHENFKAMYFKCVID